MKPQQEDFGSILLELENQIKNELHNISKQNSFMPMSRDESQYESGVTKESNYDRLVSRGVERRYEEDKEN